MERQKIKDYYENPEYFINELLNINVRKIKNLADKELIKKLKRWYKTYGVDMDLYETQYARFQIILNDLKN